MPLTVKFEGSQIPSAAIAASIEAIVAETPVLALATSGADGVPHANMAFFALGDEFDLYFVSESTSRHGRNTTANSQTSAAVFVQPPEFGEHLQGMQLAGDCTVAYGDTAVAAFEAYQARYPSFARDAEMRASYLEGTAPSSLYRFRVRSLTMVDEPRLGRRNYLHLDVVR